MEDVEYFLKKPSLSIYLFSRNKPPLAYILVIFLEPHRVLHHGGRLGSYISGHTLFMNWDAYSPRVKALEN